MTREGVRYLLKEGAKHGLFEYEVSKEKKLEQLIESDLDKLSSYYNINYKKYRKLARMEKCIEEYFRIVNILGHHPTTTEMHTRDDWRSTWYRIDRLWGSISNFREEFAIKKPKFRMHPHTKTAFNKVIQKRKLIKKQNKEKVLHFIKEKGPVSCKIIRDELGLGKVIWVYINELMAEKLIVRVDRGVKTKYIAYNRKKARRKSGK
jgi:hypothetical protein